MSNYEARHQAVVDGIRLVRELHAPEQPTNGAAFQTVKISRPPLDLFDVLEVARFLLDEEEDDVPARPHIANRDGAGGFSCTCGVKDPALCKVEARR